ncbi:rrm domain-containing protein [Moniliophthora roreri]|nr:rrm domain-containing protein [Moniliophthora roreri]
MLEAFTNELCTGILNSAESGGNGERKPVILGASYLSPSPLEIQLDFVPLQRLPKAAALYCLGG